MSLKVTFSDIQKAAQVIENVTHRTPLEASHTASSMLGASCYFKLENLQKTGSFKIRGAYNKIHSLSAEHKKKGVIASSAGNHAQGVARSAQLQGVRATIVMPKGASLVKAQATQSYGAQVIFHGDSVDEAILYAKDLAKDQGLTFLHPYADPWVIAGQGTIGLECYNQLPEVDTIIVPIGGGGLISGIATAIKHLKPHCRILGVVSDCTPGMKLLKEKITQTHQTEQDQKTQPTHHANFCVTIADGIAVKKPSQEIFEHFIDPYVDHIASVSDEEIAEAIVFAMERMKIVIEGSGAAPLAAALHGKLKLGNHNIFILSGGNIDLNLMAKIIQKFQLRHGRIAEVGISVSDLPGSLNSITHLIAQSGANILDVRHDRLSSDLGLRETRIFITMETKDALHTKEIVEDLRRKGFSVVKDKNH
ncbi:MAG: threonine ammonia-lyase [Bdellovibrionaceae bacterium]|nr:threonine ammonia-lyase [Pseudobdellovibrionaceae bacterium]MDW8190090.1 threonine ammonia-lyase [Pseudobdellovibrionaceae bacterium]